MNQYYMIQAALRHKVCANLGSSACLRRNLIPTPVRYLSSSPPVLPPIPPSLLPPKLSLPSSTAPLKARDNNIINKGENKSWFDKLVSRYSLRQKRERFLLAESMFQAATVQSQDPRWYGPGRIARDFRSRHALLTMHVWFLHKRLINDTIDKDFALLLQQEFFEVFWSDTTCRIREQGVNELLVNKNLQRVQKYTFMHLTHYDHVYSKELLEDPQKRLAELHQLILIHILLQKPLIQNENDKTLTENTNNVNNKIDYCFDHVNRIAWYIEANYQNIVMECPDEYFREARMKWVDLPDFTNMVDNSGNKLQTYEVNPEDILPYPWQRTLALSGTEFFWNTETLEVSWNRPLKS